MDFALVSSSFDTLRIPAPPKLTLLDASILASAHVPPFPPEMPALVLQVNSSELAQHLKQVLLTTYPREHMIVAVTRGEKEERELGGLELLDFSEATCLFIPALGEGTSFESFTEIVAHLRAPNGCPWDREQTHATLRPNLLEEAYETLEAIDRGDPAVMRDELGDLLFQVVIHAQLAREEGHFTLADVAKTIAEKLVRRHPHVFEGKPIEGDVLQQWERIKREEKPEGERGSILEGIPVSLPSLFRAERLQERVERVGVEVPAIDLPVDIDDERFLGDLLFDLVAAARALGYDAESALREANERFGAHVARMESRAGEAGRELESYDPDEIRALWEETA